jgi:hypothetical protein
MNKIAVFLITICFSCGQIKHSKPLSIIGSNSLDTSKIRYDGFYNKLDTTIINYECEAKGKRYNEIYSSIDLIVFNNKKNIYINGGGTIGKEPSTCDYYSGIIDWHKNHNQDPFGSYRIKNDSIYAYVPITLKTWGMIPRIVKCNYRGYIKNRDTIVDWKIIPPYPKGTSKFILENNKDLFQSQTLYFVKTDAVKCLQMD